MARESNGKRVVLFEDEAGFSLHPKLGRVWAKKGSQPTIYTRGNHQKRLNVFGWVDPVNGLHGMIKWVAGNTGGFLKLLMQIVHRFQGKIIDLWVDQARWHNRQTPNPIIFMNLQVTHEMTSSIFKGFRVKNNIFTHY